MNKEGFRERLESLIGDEPPYGWAARMGISKGAFTRIWREGSVPGPELLVKIKRATDASIDWLLTGEGRPPDCVYKIERLKSAQWHALIEGRKDDHDRLEGEIEAAKTEYREKKPGVFEPDASRRAPVPIDMELLEISIEAAAMCMEMKQVKLSPEKHAKLISLIYELYMDDEDPKVNTAQIIRLVDLAS